MDPFTHILLGASLGYAALGRRLGRAAAGVGGLAAFAPDADVFIRSAADPLVAIEHHRGFTHALAFAPVGAGVVAVLWLLRPAWRDPARWGLLWLAGTIAYVSHMLLDAATSYGTQLLWPFSNQRFGWDVISIIDPIFTLALLAGLIWALMRQRLGPVVAALGFAAAYIAWGAAQHARASAAQEALAAARGHTRERFEVMPTLANNVVWRALYVHDGKIYSDRIRVGWFSGPAVREGWALPLVAEGGLAAGERERDTRRSFARFAWFSEHWVARSPADATVLGDMRYSLSAEAFDPIWGIRYTVPGAPTEVEWVNRSRERQVAPGMLWQEISGGDARFRPLGAR
jgi:inner membrane protein